MRENIANLQVRLLPEAFATVVYTFPRTCPHTRLPVPIPSRSGLTDAIPCSLREGQGSRPPAGADAQLPPRSHLLAVADEIQPGRWDPNRPLCWARRRKRVRRHWKKKRIVEKHV